MYTTHTKHQNTINLRNYEALVFMIIGLLIARQCLLTLEKRPTQEPQHGLHYKKISYTLTKLTANILDMYYFTRQRSLS
jgi:hypothetical protein